MCDHEQCRTHCVSPMLCLCRVDFVARFFLRPVNVTGGAFGTDALETSAVTFAVDPLPDGFFINPLTGLILGIPQNKQFINSTVREMLGVAGHPTLHPYPHPHPGIRMYWYKLTLINSTWSWKVTKRRASPFVRLDIEHGMSSGRAMACSTRCPISHNVTGSYSLSALGESTQPNYLGPDIFYPIERMPSLPTRLSRFKKMHIVGLMVCF